MRWELRLVSLPLSGAMLLLYLGRVSLQVVIHSALWPRLSQPLDLELKQILDLELRQILDLERHRRALQPKLHRILLSNKRLSLAKLLTLLLSGSETLGNHNNRRRVQVMGALRLLHLLNAVVRCVSFSNCIKSAQLFN